MGHIWRVFLIILLLLLVAACDTLTPEPSATPTETPTLTRTVTPTPLPQPTPLPRAIDLTRATDPAQQAYMRVIHAAPDAPTFNVFVERLAVATNLSYTQSTEPSGIVAGDYMLRVVPLNETESLFETSFSPKGGESLILIFTGTPAALKMSSFTESTEPLGKEQSRITFIQAVQGSGSITMQQNTVDLTPALAFGGAALPVTVSSGNVNLNFRSESGVLLSYPINLQERVNYTFALVGQPDSVKVIKAETRAPGSASIRALNAVTSLVSLDIVLDDLLLANNLDYSRVSERRAVPAHIYTVNVYRAGTDRASELPLTTSQLIANDDDIISLIIMGTPEDLRVVLYREDLSPTSPSQTRIAFSNILSNVTNIRVETQAGPIETIGDLGYAQSPQIATLETDGVYTFFWNKVENGAAGEQIESTQDIIFEPGRVYLYLVTGGTPPLILSERVGIAEGFAGLALGETPTVTPETPTRIRFVNAVYGGLPMTLTVNGLPISTGQAYGDGSVLHIVSSGNHTIEAQITESGEGMASMDTSFDPVSDYSIFAYGFGTQDIRLLVVNDSSLVLGGNSPHFRLVNTSISDGQLGLAHSTSASTSANPSRFSESPAGELFRRSIPFGVTTIVGMESRPGSVSNVLLAPIGTYDVHILDTVTKEIAATIRQVNLQAGIHFDVIAFQHPDSQLVEGFVLPYPSD